MMISIEKKMSINISTPAKKMLQLDVYSPLSKESLANASLYGEIDAI